MTQPEVSTVGCLPPITNWLCAKHNKRTVSYKTKNTRRRKRINKASIGPPKNFQHTGHIGVNSLRRGNLDPNKIRTQLAEVAAVLRLDDDPDSKLEQSRLLATAKPIVHNA